MLMDNGHSSFFGTLQSAKEYFERIGFPCPPSVTPTDYFLQISDKNFSSQRDFNFHETFKTSPEMAALTTVLAQHQTDAESVRSMESPTQERPVPFWFKVCYRRLLYTPYSHPESFLLCF